MTETKTRLPLALCGYSLPHVMGYMKTKGGESPAEPLDSLGLLRKSKEYGLEGVEFSLAALVPSFDGALVETGERVHDWGTILREMDLKVIADYGNILENSPEQIKAYLKLSADAGAKVVRVVLSGMLCGDRRGLKDGWLAYREALGRRLKEVIPYAEEVGVCVAVENHQDAASDDLLWLAEQVNHSPAFGVTLDTGNPLAVAEDPVEFTQRIAHIIRHIHMKDYTVHLAPEGYRLVRCAAGDGVIDFPGILKIVSQNGHEVLPANEIAAQATRTIPVNEPSWWECYPKSQKTRYQAVLPLLDGSARPANEPYSSAWERGEDSAMVVAEEWNIVDRSIAYFQSWIV